ncbi:hypothetical protein ACVNP1_01230 [Staphylococcus aureus]
MKINNPQSWLLLLATELPYAVLEANGGKANIKHLDACINIFYVLKL